MLDAWLVTRRDLALAVMRDDGAFTVDDPRFSTARVVGPSMLSREGSEHDRHRAPFAPVFRRDAVRERFTALVAEETERLLDALAPAGAGELRRGFAGPLAAVVVMHALGLEDAGTAAVLGWYDAIVAAVDGAAAGRALTTASAQAFADLRAAVAVAHERAPLAAGLTTGEVASNAAVLLFGGIETTEGMIANAIVHLLGHAARPSENALEESLRLEPAAATIDRYATRDLELAGAPIRAGDLVTVSIAAANRDPAAFPDPDRFDPARANARQHLAFAHGPHVCLGMHLARLEAHTALEQLFARMPGLRLERPAPARGLVFRKPRAVHARWRS